MGRLPYKRNAPLVGRTMWRNIVVQVRASPRVVPHFAVRGLATLWTRALLAARPLHPAPLRSRPALPILTACCPLPHRPRPLSPAQVVYQMTVLLTLLFKGKDILDLPVDGRSPCIVRTVDKRCDQYDYTHYTIIFNFFVFCQLFNQFNCRQLHSGFNIMTDIKGSTIFTSLVAAEMFIQVILVEFGASFVHTEPLSAAHWALSVGLAATCIPVGACVRAPRVPARGARSRARPARPRLPCRASPLAPRLRRLPAAAHPAHGRVGGLVLWRRHPGAGHGRPGAHARHHRHARAPLAGGAQGGRRRRGARRRSGGVRRDGAARHAEPLRRRVTPGGSCLPGRSARE